jgi:hypothetical protein
MVGDAIDTRDINEDAIDVVVPGALLSGRGYYNLRRDIANINGVDRLRASAWDRSAKRMTRQQFYDSLYKYGAMVIATGYFEESKMSISKYIEACSLSMLPIAQHYEGIEEELGLVHEKNALFFETYKDCEKLVKDYYKEPKKYFDMRRRAHELSTSRYSLQAKREELIKILEDIING